MLKTNRLSVYAHRGRERIAILKDVDAEARLGDLVAIVGPSGCGKSTLLKAIAGLAHYAEGGMTWLDREIDEAHDIEPEMLAYIPQFGIFHEELTVGEILTDAATLRLGQLAHTSGRVREVAKLTGLDDLLPRQAKVLSGGQKRRLALAMELVSEPVIILADEVTSGLDPKSSSEITILLRNLAHDKQKIVLHVTHELKHIDRYDAVIVLLDGRLVFQGPSRDLISYFQIEDPDDLYQQLSGATAEEWRAAWNDRASQTKAQSEAPPPSEAAF